MTKLSMSERIHILDQFFVAFKFSDVDVGDLVIDTVHDNNNIPRTGLITSKSNFQIDISKNISYDNFNLSDYVEGYITINYLDANGALLPRDELYECWNK